jgi:hypothetical protein
MSNWLDRFIKRAIDKLPQDELNGQFPPFTGAAADPNAPPDPSQDPSMGGGMDPSMMGGAPPPMDPSMMMPPPEDKPLVWNNKYLVKTDSTEFVVELSPKIVSAPPPMPPMAGPPPGPPQDPMADKSNNPNADPQKLQDWINAESENLGQNKPFSNDEKAPADPLTAEEDGLPIEDTGDEQALNPKVKVHQKKAAAEILPGIDRSNAYAPCSFCSNYIAADNRCAQGLDVEKVQAAKSCSWLNSTMKPFGKPKDSFLDGQKDKETTTTDVADLQGGGNSGGGGPNKFS